MNDQAPLTIVYRWELRDPKRRSGWRLLTWMMSEDDAGAWAKAEGAELRKVEGSREERRNLQGFHPIAAGTPLHFYPKSKPGKAGE